MALFIPYNRWTTTFILNITKKPGFTSQQTQGKYKTKLWNKNTTLYL